MDDFLTASPSLTPLTAGATTTTITGTLVSQFNLPGSWVAIVTCIILSSLVKMKPGLSYYQRAIFYLINAITIFTVAMGLNAAGIAATKSYHDTKPAVVARSVLPEETVLAGDRPFFDEWF